MQKPRPFILILALIAVAAGGWYYLYGRTTSATSGTLTASGTVETNEISIAPEVSGRIVELNVQEGDVVKAGDILFRLDDTLLQAQHSQAAAALETAKGSVNTASAAAAVAETQYQITLNAAQAQDKKTRVADWFMNAPGEFEQPMWYFEKDQQIAAAQTEIASAKEALDAANQRLDEVEAKASSGDFITAEKNLLEARVAFIVAKQVLDLTGGATDVNVEDLPLPKGLPYRAQINVGKQLEAGQNDLHDSAQSVYDDAKNTLDDAQEAYDDALTTDGATDVFNARADVAVAEERYATAQDYLRSLQTGSDSLQVVAAQKVLDQANAAVSQAQLAADQAQASLDLLNAQIAKTVVAAPVDGVVMTRVGEPGSVVNAGGTVLTVGRLDELTITVYVPEDRMGEVSLGQTATVAVDSFPGQTFAATVTYIADQAEFTPRNVQTVEGRKNTVFAVKLKLGDTSNKLKPGMPADVTFSAQ